MINLTPQHFACSNEKKNMLSKDSVFNFIAVNFVVPTYVVMIGVCIIMEW